MAPTRSTSAKRPELPTVSLGSTGLSITRTGFGAWAIGGGGWHFGWGAQDDADSIAAIRHAVECGINWIDTAAAYGLGHSEEVVARALRDIPRSERPYVFTKCGLVWDERDRAAPPRRVGNPASLRREVDASLRRLGVERIDLYQMHWPPDDGTPLADYWGTLLALKAEGKIRAAGLSNHDVRLLEQAERIGHVDTLQPHFSAIARGVAAAELPWCGAHGTGVIVYSPMHSGLLTGVVHRGAGRAPRVGRLALACPRLHRSGAASEPGAGGGARAHRAAAGHVGRRRCGRLDAGVAGGHRRHRGRALARARWTAGERRRR